MANSRFSKVNIGRTNLRGRNDLSHTLGTSADFGSVQPLLCRYMMAKSHLKGDISGSIRCMPLPLPPFGKIGFHMYGQFVPMDALLRNWHEFETQTPISTSIKTYTPQFVPRLPMWGPVSIMSLLFTSKFSFYGVFKLEDISSGEASVNVPDEHDKLGWALTARFADGVDVLDFNTLKSSLVGVNEATALQINTWFGFSSMNNTSTYFYNGFGTNRITSDTDALWQKFVDSGISLQNADFVLFYNSTDGTGSSATRKRYVIPVWLTAEGRRLVKVLRACGMQPSTTDTDYYSLMPLFAYYKAYFDIFYPQREINWKNTAAYKLLDWFCESGREFMEIGTSAITNKNVSLRTFGEFLYNVADAYATFDTDYFTASIASMNDYSFDGGPVLYQGAGSESAQDSRSTDHGFPQLSVPTNVTSFALSALNKLTRYITANSVLGKNVREFLKAHYGESVKFAEDSTFAGASVMDIQLGDVLLTSDTEQGSAGEYAGVGFGKGNYRVDYSTDKPGYFIVLGAVIPRNTYTQGSSKDSQMTEFTQFPMPEFDALGYETVKKSELLSCSLRWNSDDDVSPFPFLGSGVFGYNPRYTSHKCQQSLLNGDFVLNGTKDQYLGMSLDRYITSGLCKPAVVGRGSSSGSGFNALSWYYPSSDFLKTGVDWRFAGRSFADSNYDRVFKYNNGYNSNSEGIVPSVTAQTEGYFSNGHLPTFDNFICYFEESLTYVAPLKSVGQSYYTLEGSDDYVEHQ